MYGARLSYNGKEIQSTEMRCVEDMFVHFLREAQEKNRLKRWDRARIRRILGDHPSVDQCVELAEAMKECSL